MEHQAEKQTVCVLQNLVRKETLSAVSNYIKKVD